jgi:hypothetical protein
MQACEEVAGSFFIACGDASELFDKIEEALNEVTFGIECEVATSCDLAVRFWRDDRFDGSHLKALNKAICVVAFVAEEGFGLHLCGEGFGLVDIVDLPACKADGHRIAQGVDDHMNFGGQAAARAAYGLVGAPFLRAPALC